MNNKRLLAMAFTETYFQDSKSVSKEQFLDMYVQFLIELEELALMTECSSQYLRDN